jgi:ZIP family zinc transporter
MAGSQENVPFAFALVTAAGLCTTVGASFACCFDKANKQVLAASLGVSAGVMLFISFVEILSIKAVAGFADAGYSDGESYLFAQLSFFAGIAITMVLDHAVHQLMAGQQIPGHDGCHGHDHAGTKPTVAGKEPEAADVEFGVSVRDNPCAEGGSSLQPNKASPPDVKPSADKSNSFVAERTVTGGTSDTELKQMGMITALAIALHNLPEGLATFVATLADPHLGIAVAFAIALHNIPEGLCVAMPLYYSTGSRVQGFLWAFVSGLSEPLGGLIGYVILAGSDMHPLAYGVVFAVVAGMMVYISFQELLPTALRYDGANSVTIKAVFVGMAVMDLSIVLFQV